MCLGVWRTQPQSHSGVILGTFRAAKKSLRPIASVHSWVRIELLARLNPIWRSFGGGFASSAEWYTGACLFFPILIPPETPLVAYPSLNGCDWLLPFLFIFAILWCLGVAEISCSSYGLGLSFLTCSFLLSLFGSESVNFFYCSHFYRV